ncbi:Protein lifeguard 4 [Armadillidium vulgare]|nr:Protein lifeguard 4 [Armadillidium vulgare]
MNCGFPSDFMCIENVASKHINILPTNLFLLGAFTIVVAVSVGIVVGSYELTSGIMALGLVLATVVSLTLYTFQSKRDFSKLGTGLMMGLIVVSGGGIMNWFYASKVLDLLVTSSSASLFSLYIVYDTQMMMKKISSEEYILATIKLYLDILNLFLSFLESIGKRNTDF